MGIINYKRNNKKSNFNVKNIFLGILVYCCSSLGACIGLIFARADRDARLMLHSAQSMLFYLLFYLAQRIAAVLGFYFMLNKVFLLISIAFPVFGLVKYFQNDILKVPFIYDLAERYIY